MIFVRGVMHSCTSCGVGDSTYTDVDLSASGNDGCVTYNRNGDLDGSHLSESTMSCAISVSSPNYLYLI